MYVMREMFRRSIYVAALALLCFGPGAFAQSKITSSASSASVTNGAGMFMLSPIFDEWNRDRKKRRAPAPEGGSAALYLLTAGLACCGALYLSSRKARAEKAV